MSKLTEAASRLKSLQAQVASTSEWHSANEAFGALLNVQTDADEVWTILNEDELDELPIEAKTLAFETVLALGKREPEVLRQYADHLWLHGPAADDRVQALRDEAQRLEERRG